MKIKKKKSPAKRIEPAPRACQLTAITITPRHNCDEGLTSLYLLGACENLNFQNLISRNNWGSGSCHSGIITHSYRTFGTASFVQPVWKNFMALASARPDCLVSSSGADHGPGLGLARTVTFLYDQPLVSVWSDTSQRLVNHKLAASQPLIRVWLVTNCCSVDKVLIEKPF